MRQKDLPSTATAVSSRAYSEADSSDNYQSCSLSCQDLERWAAVVAKVVATWVVEASLGGMGGRDVSSPSVPAVCEALSNDGLVNMSTPQVNISQIHFGK